jgi:hypothetical protein
VHHLSNEFSIGTATKCRIEVNKVNPLGTLLDPRQSSIEWGAVRGFRSSLTLNEANGLPIGNVDSGQQVKCGLFHVAYPTH